MRAQAASPRLAVVFAALLAVVNTKLPHIGELLCQRVLAQFQRGYLRNDKPAASSALTFIAHLVNQRVLSELVALEILTVLLGNPTDDSVELAAAFTREVGAALESWSRQALHELFVRFRAILQDGAVSKKAQFVVEAVMATRKAGFEAQARAAPCAACRAAMVKVVRGVCQVAVNVSAFTSGFSVLAGFTASWSRILSYLDPGGRRPGRTRCWERRSARRRGAPARMNISSSLRRGAGPCRGAARARSRRGR